MKNIEINSIEQIKKLPFDFPVTYFRYPKTKTISTADFNIVFCYINEPYIQITFIEIIKNNKTIFSVPGFLLDDFITHLLDVNSTTIEKIVYYLDKYSFEMNFIIKNTSRIYINNISLRQIWFEIISPKNLFCLLNWLKSINNQKFTDNCGLIILNDVYYLGSRNLRDLLIESNYIKDLY